MTGAVSGALQTFLTYGLPVALLSVPFLQLRIPPPKRRRRKPRRKGPAYVYRVVNAHGRRGYIGKTNNLRRRLREHGFDPDHVEVRRCPDEMTALAVERAAIEADARNGHPLVNVIHNPWRP